MHKKRPTSQLKAGIRLHKAGNLVEAAKTYRQVLSVDPKQSDALHLLGVIAHAGGKYDDAVNLISESLRINPRNADALNDLAGIVQGRGGLSQAAELYNIAIAAAPKGDHLYSNRGEVLRRLGRYDEAQQSFSSALKLNPNSRWALTNLGTLYIELESYAEAEKCFRRALTANPGLPQAHCNLGVALKMQGKYAEADECFECALVIQAQYAPAYVDLGASLKAQGRLTEAVQSYWHALEINPRSDLALTNLGNALMELGKFADAIGCLKKAVELNPNSHFAQNNLGSALIDVNRSGDALSYLRRALEIRPQYAQAHNNLGTALMALGRSSDAAECFRRAVQIRPQYSEAHSNLLLALNYLPDPDREALFSEHLRFDEMFGKPLRNIIPLHVNNPDPARRLRVGYVSGDLREHPVAFFIQPVLAEHSRENFEIYCYANQNQKDAITEQLRASVEHWRHVAALSDAELAAAIQRDQIDILVDLSGHTAKNRLIMFARKPAPVQVTMIGYMQTTGLAAMDYRITDEAIDPPGQTEQWNTEKLIRLSTGAAAFRPPASSPPVNELPALKNGCVTFGSFNSLSKVTPEVIDTWARILHYVPTSRLLLVAHAGNAVIADFEEHGIGADRLEIVPRLPLHKYLALHHRVDFLLDTFPYNGGTTSIMALWMGVPFVTLASGGAVGRVGAGLLAAVGLPELATSDPDQYLQMAVSAVADLPKLLAERESLRGKLTQASILSDERAHTLELEKAYRRMWVQWCEAQNAGAAGAAPLPNPGK